MTKLRSAVLSITFVPDPVDYAIVTAFTIPEKEAYQVSIENLGELDQYGKEFEDQQKALQAKVLNDIKSLKRYPDCDYDDHPIAPICQMFSKGFYESDWNSYFYAGMGHFGYFLGVIEGEIEGHNMMILRKVEAETEKRD